MKVTTRREFLRASAAATACALAGSAAVAQPGSVRVRRSVLSSLAPVVEYRDGVRVMKTRPVTDPTSWLYQANMHGTYSLPPTGALWNQCQHGSFFFLSWHRMYVYWFERIVRKACGNTAFALPYWNYTSTSAADRRLPLGFRQVSVGGQPNALYHSARNPALNSVTNPAQLPYSATLFSTAFAYTNFSSPTGSGASFGGQVRATPAHGASPHGQLESQPHDIIHTLISGDMGDPNRAARDPIFWLHHANIDRLWKRWLQQGGGRANPIGNGAWMNTVFKFFDENGNPVEMKGSDVLDTVYQLQYRYDDDPSVLGPAAAAAALDGVLAKGVAKEKEGDVQTIAAAEKTGVPLGTRPVRVAIPLKEEARGAVTRLIDAAPAAVPDHALILRLEDVTFDRPPGIYYEVYIDLPAHEDDPDFHNGHYVGNLGFFAEFPAEEGGHGHAQGAAGEGAKVTHVFDISGVVRELARQKKWDADTMTVTLVPRGLEDENGHPLELKPDAKIKVGKVTLNSPKQ